MNPKIKSMLIFFVAGPTIASVIGNGGHPMALFPPILFFAIIMCAPTSLLAGAFFNLTLAMAARIPSVSYIWYGSGALIGGASGAIAAKLTMYFPIDKMDTSSHYVFCGVIGAICGAICCINGIDLEQRETSSN
jgi:hypothetical protein